VNSLDDGLPSDEFDQFDYDNEFDYGGDFNNSQSIKKGSGGGVGSSSPPSLPAPALSKTQKSPLPSKNQKRRSKTLYDSSDSSSSDSSSSSSDDDELVLSSKKKAPTKKKPMGKKQMNSNIGASRIGGLTKKVKPTVTSPNITLSSLSKNSKNSSQNSTPTKKKKKPPVMGRKPMGKPINNKLSSKAMNDDDENTENQQQAATTSKGKRKKAPAGENKQTVSFSKNTKKGAAASSSSDEASKGSNKKKKGNEKNANKSSNNNNSSSSRSRSSKSSKYVSDCLQDTDDDESSEDDEVTIMEKKTAKKQKSIQKAIVQVGTNSRGNSRDDNSSHEKQHRIQVLPLRGLAIDNRAIPTVSGDSMARHSFLGYIPRLLEGGLEKGVLFSTSAASSSASSSTAGSTVVASLAHGTKCSQREGAKGRVAGKGRAGALVQTAVVPRVSYLFESRAQETTSLSTLSTTLSPQDGSLSREERATWLSDLLAPINSGFGGRNGTNGNNGLDTAMASSMSDATSNENSYSGPNGFAAGDSWSYFGDLVEAIEYKLSCSSNTDSNQARPITLFTTDANLFADIQSSAHIRGLEQFWKRIHTSASERNTVISSVTIMIVEITSVMQMMKTIKSSYDDSYNSATSMDEHNNGSMANESNNDSFDSSSSLLIPNRLHVIQCVNDIRRRIHEFNRSQQELLESSSEVMMTSTINVQLEFMEGNAVSFQSLLQTWVKESFTQTYASSSCTTSTSDSACGGGGVQGRLSFDLPETLDGIMCSISLDLQYTILPHGIDSPATMGLVDDMRCISMLSSPSSSSTVEVIQTIPLSSVDSSLIYGVPMSARAGLENDISRYNEMQMLARQLWKYLSRNDVGLVLRVRPGSNSEDSNEGLGYHSSSSGGEQQFLLVCEEAVEEPPQALLDHDSNLDPSEALKVVPDKQHGRRGEAPCHGMLYRYATKSQILRFGNEEKRLGAAEEEEVNNNSNEEMSDHYLDYIERSLDALVKTGLNPLLM